MALPVNVSPIYTLVVPSTGKTVKYRPFLVKEEKALLIAQQSEDMGVMVDTLKDIIKNCIKDDINTNDLAVFDLEYIFTQIRAKSVGETVELLFSCDTESCADNEKAKVKLSIDLTKLEVERDPTHDKNIALFGDVGIMMKYPSMDTLKHLQGLTSDTDLNKIFTIIADLIDYIYQGDEVFSAKDQTKEEMMTFLENLTSDQFLRIQKFFTTMPRIKKHIEFKCPVCEKQNQRVLEGLQNFF